MTDSTDSTVAAPTGHRPAIRAWLAALRDPTTLQGFGQLATRLTRDDWGYCCLGVAEQTRGGCRWEYRFVANLESDAVGQHVSFLPLRDDETPESVEWINVSHRVFPSLLRYDTAGWLGLVCRDPFVVPPRHVTPDPQPVTLSRLNDAYRLPLRVIADVIEAQPFDWDGSYDQAATTAERRDPREARS